MATPPTCPHSQMLYGSTCLNCKREEREAVDLIKTRLKQTVRTVDTVEDRLAGLKLPHGYSVSVAGGQLRLSRIRPVTIEGTFSYDH